MYIEDKYYSAHFGDLAMFLPVIGWTWNFAQSHLWADY